MPCSSSVKSPGSHSAAVAVELHCAMQMLVLGVAEVGTHLLKYRNGHVEHWETLSRSRWIRGIQHRSPSVSMLSCRDSHLISVLYCVLMSTSRIETLCAASGHCAPPSSLPHRRQGQCSSVTHIMRSSPSLGCKVKFEATF